MQAAYFQSQIDLEIGDFVYLLDKPISPIMIYDIRCIYEMRSRHVYFEFKLLCDHGNFSSWLPRAAISERIL